MKRIVQVGEDDFYKIFERLPKKPKYWRTASRRIRNAAQHVIDRYQGQAEKIWNDNPKAGVCSPGSRGLMGLGKRKRLWLLEF